MKVLLKLTLLAALLGLTAWALHTRRPRAEAVTPPVLSGPSKQVPEGAPLAVPSASPASSEPTRTSQALDPPRRTALELPRSVFEATVVDPSGGPLSGIRLVSVEVPQQSSQPSGADGNLRLEFAWPTATRSQRLQLQLRGDDRAWHHLRVEGADLESSEPVFLGRIVLQPGGTVRGRVIDPRGQPCAGVTVYAAATLEWSPRLQQRFRATGRMSWPGLGTGIAPRTETAADGAYLLEGVPAVFVVVGAWQEGAFHSFTRELGVRAGAVTEAGDVVLERAGDADVIAGHVWSAAGQAIVGAEIRLLDEESSSMYASTVSDESGAFRMVGVRGETHVVSARHPDGGPRIESGPVSCGDVNVELRFVSNEPIAVRLVTPGGSPIEAASIWLFDVEERPILSSSEPLEEGLYAVSRPQQRFRVGAGAPGFQAVRSELFDPAELTQEIVLQLESGGRLSGVVRSQGEPVRGARVHLHRKVMRGELGRFYVGLFTRVDRAMLQSAETDSEGRFTLPMSGSATLEVHAEADGLTRQSSSMIDFQVGTDRSDIDLELFAGGSIEGRVLVASGVDPRGTIIGASSGDGHIEIERADAQGRFSFASLSPGRWQVIRVDPDTMQYLHDDRVGMWRRPEQDPWSVTVASGEATLFELDLLDEITNRLHGRLLMGGSPPRGWSASIPPRSPVTQLDTEGRFVMELMAQGELRLWFTTAFAAGRRSTLRVMLEIVSGENHWDLDLPLGKVDLEGLPPVPEPESPDGYRPELALVSEAAGETIWETSFFFTPGGRVRIENVPAGSCYVTRRPEQGAGYFPESWPRLVEFELLPGEDKRIVIGE